MGKNSSPPPAPDYTAAAKATAAGNQKAAQIAQVGNMVNQYTPYGSTIYTPKLSAKELQAFNESGTLPQDRAIQWEQRVNLSPEQQAAYNKDVAMNARLQDVGIQGVGYVQSALDKPLSFEDMQALGSPGEIQAAASDAAYKNAMR